MRRIALYAVFTSVLAAVGCGGEGDDAADGGANASSDGDLCGNGVIDEGEYCDDGKKNGRHGYCKEWCLAMGPYCGDGLVNGPEACDDGNNEDGDVCSADCLVNECPNGTFDDDSFTPQPADVEGYTSFAGNLEIGYTDLSNLEGLECLRSVGALNITDNASMASLEGLHNLTRIDGSTYLGQHWCTLPGGNYPPPPGWCEPYPVSDINVIADNPMLTDLDGLRGLEYISNSLYIERNRSLKNLEGLRSVSSFSQTLPGDIPSLTIHDNDALTSLEGLDGLAPVLEVPLFIDDNDELADLEGLNDFTSMEWLVITENDTLSDLNALRNLSSVHVLKITNNPELPTCDAEALRDRLDVGPDGVEICGNLEDECGSEPCE